MVSLELIGIIIMSAIKVPILLSRVTAHARLKSTKKHAFHMNSFSLEVTLVKLDVRKCLDIVCEIQRAIFVRQLVMFLNGDKMMKLFKLRLHLF